MLAIARENKDNGIVANALVLGGVAFPGRPSTPEDSPPPRRRRKSPTC